MQVLHDLANTGDAEASQQIAFYWECRAIDQDFELAEMWYATALAQAKQELADSSEQSFSEQIKKRKQIKKRIVSITERLSRVRKLIEQKFQPGT